MKRHTPIFRFYFRFPPWLFLLLPALLALLPAPSAAAQTDLAATTSTATTSTANQLLDQAQRLANLHFLNQAKTVLDGAIARYPEDWRLHRLYIETHEGMSRTHDLVPLYKDWIAKHPESVIGYAGAARVNLTNDAKGVAEEFYNQAQKLAPESLAVLDLAPQLARTPIMDFWIDRKEKKNKTRVAYERLAEAYPDFSPGWEDYLSFLASFDESRLRRVFPTIKNRIGLSPALWVFEFDAARPDVWHDPRADIALFERILKADATLIGIRGRLARAWGNLGEPDRQREILESITRDAPEFLFAWANLAHFCAIHQEYDRAIECYERALATPYESPRKEYLAFDIVDCLIQSGRFDQAEARLTEISANPGNAIQARQAREKLVTLTSRKPEDRIQRLAAVPYLKQKGAYCGPASLSMIFGYWGVRKTQDEIAAVIYTGIAGTAAQTIQTYCETQGFEAHAFQGSVESWKRLLDQGVPVLWLNYPSLVSGHYRVVTGYDDLTKEFILHNPWRADEERQPCQDIDDEWALPNLKLSLAIYPAAKAGALQLGELPAPLVFRFMNGLTYLATGSNLFAGFFPQALWDLLLPTALLAACLLLIRRLAYPRRMLWRYGALIMAAALGLILAIYLWRRPLVVSLFVSLQASMLALAVALLAAGLLTALFRRNLTPRQALRLHAVLFLAIAAFGIINFRDTFGINIPLLILLGGAAFALRETWLVPLRAGLARRLNYAPVLAVLARFGSGAGDGAGTLEALWREITLEMRRRNFPRAEALVRALLSGGGLDRYHRTRLRLALAECLIAAPEARRDSTRLIEARHALNAAAAERPGRLAARHAEILRARSLLTEGEIEPARELCETIEQRLRRRDPILSLQRWLERLRGRGDTDRRYLLLHALNRLAIARARGAAAELEATQRELADALDHEFYLKYELTQAD